jgi:hypothetical protein
MLWQRYRVKLFRTDLVDFAVKSQASVTVFDL